MRTRPGGSGSVCSGHGAQQYWGTRGFGALPGPAPQGGEEVTLFLHRQKDPGFLALSASGLLSGPLPSRSCGLPTSPRTLLPTVFSMAREGVGRCKRLLALREDL